VTKIKTSNLTGKDVSKIPLVQDVVADNRVAWKAWAPEDPNNRSSLDNSKVKKIQSNTCEISDDDDIDNLDIPRKPSVGKTSLASRWKNNKNTTTMPTASSFTAPPPSSASSSSSSSSLNQQLMNDAFSNHMSIKTVDAVTRDQYDASKDQQVKAGQQVQQSQLRVLCANLVQRLFSHIVPASTSAPSSSSSATSPDERRHGRARGPNYYPYEHRQRGWCHW